MTETLKYGFSSKSSQQELWNEYQHDRVQMVLKNCCYCALDESSFSNGGI